jgi:hypothetical protein
MNEAYFFQMGVLDCILNIQTSRIGYSYPRVFVRFPDNSYLNIDFTLGRMFAMSEADWNSWLNGSHVVLDTIKQVRNKFIAEGLDWDAFDALIFYLCDECKEEC